MSLPLADRVAIRLLQTSDSLSELTDLLHRAYARLAAEGFRYHATWQDESTTRRRCEMGECYLAMLDGRIVGTVTLLDADKTSGSPWYDQPGVACFGQFGVEPAFQHRGIGARMLDLIEARAAAKGLRELALDTAEGAGHLIDWYKSRGYRFVEHVQWDITNYRSVILSKRLRDDLSDYYAKRAAEYDAIYAKPERQGDLRAVGQRLVELLAGRRVLEVACGTGFWTRRIAEVAASVTATDINEQMLTLARARLTGRATVRFQSADAFVLDGVADGHTAAFAGFWWSHLRRAEIGRFLDSLHARLNPGARVVVIDNRYVEGSSTPISRRDADGNTYQGRTLRRGESYEIVKNFPTEHEVFAAIDGRAAHPRYEAWTYFWCMSWDVV